MAAPSKKLVRNITPPPVIDIREMSKVYQMGEIEVHALRNVSLRIEAGEYVAIVGTSGSGKSTLMNMIGLLDRPTSGTYHISGEDVGKLGKRKLATLRNREIGFVFQRFNLLARAPARRQVELPLFYSDVPRRKACQMANEALELVGLGDRTTHRPEELSGGQQQRVAIARALVNKPSLLLADEPTGALDTKTGEEVMGIFRDLNEQGLTLIVVTHDRDIAQQAKRVVTLNNGVVISDETTTEDARGSRR